MLAAVSQYFLLLNESKELLSDSVASEDLRKFFDSFSRTCSWFLGMTAYKLIKVKEDPKDIPVATGDD